MSSSSSQFYTIQQIDAVKGIITPHYRDLKDLGTKYISTFQNLKVEDLIPLSESLGIEIENIGFGELWTITKVYFPKIKIHVLLQFDDEGLSTEPYELQFLFSGKQVHWLSGEDLCHLCEILLNYTSTILKRQFPQDIYSETPSPLLDKAMIERTINWENISIDEELLSYFDFQPFPGLKIEYNIRSKPTSFTITSNKLDRFWIYDVDRLVIMGLNQLLRLVKIKLGKQAPPICNLMFSGYYKKSNPIQFQ
ncbi:MAG: hypothetical protein JW776_15750 [Candidatus Lokiarchaeota archaeon]|nr:hypothetical protein [Candidatus Lokiarchaeota archaeon]